MSADSNVIAVSAPSVDDRLTDSHMCMAHALAVLDLLHALADVDDGSMRGLRRDSLGNALHCAMRSIGEAQRMQDIVQDSMGKTS